MEFKIEKLKTEQIPQFYQVFRQVMEQGYCYTPKIKKYFLTRLYTPGQFSYWLSNNYKGVLISKGSDPLQISGYLVYDSPYGGVLLGRWLGVIKELRQNGIGRQLIYRFIEEAKVLGCHKVELAVQQDARDFYAKCGLQEEGFRQKSYFGQDQYIFGKVIGEVDEEKIISY